MRAYSSNSFKISKRGNKMSWIWTAFLLGAGFIGGIAIDQKLSMRKPVELIISTPVQELPQGSVVETGLPEIWSESHNISVRSPQPNELVRSPFKVEGLERTFEQNVVLRLRDGKGNELVKIFTTGAAPDAGIHGPYRTELAFEKPATKTGTLEVFQASAKDGSEIDKVTVPVKFE